ncbi:MAG: acyl-CoA dehydrogenase family protein [Methyloligellaceae bacterium]
MNDVQGADSIVVDTTARIFRDLGDPQTINNARDDAWAAPLWQALEENGLTLAWVPDALGGAGAEIADGFDVLRVAGQFAVPVALAETLLAGWLLAQADLECPSGPMSIAPVGDDDHIALADDGTLSGRAGTVPFARDAAHLAVLAERGSTPAVALVEASACALSEGAGIAGDPRDVVTFDGAAPLAVRDAPAGFTQETLRLMGAAVWAQQMAGALQGILDMSVQYAKERIAFERPIGKFQAVQQNLARLAGETAAALAAAGSAADTIQQSQDFDDTVLLEAASAKIRVGEAAGEGAAIAHQVHGAIGFTQEHILHRYTRRLWGWRDEFGSESVWAVRLGRHVAANGADALWPMLAAR